MIVKCPMCGEELDEDNQEWICPFCEDEDYGDGFLRCHNCDALVDWSGDSWVCENCYNEGIEPPRRQVIYYDDFNDDEDDEYCEDEIPDVNQGWVGEHYG